MVVSKLQKIRISLDPKDVDGAIQRPKFHMRNLEELYLSAIQLESSVVSFDPKAGICQVSRDEESSKLTAFWTPLGRYRLG